MIRFFFNKSSVSSYLFSVLIVIAAVYYHFRETTVQFSFFNEKNTTAFLLILCLLTTDWAVKQRYWANKSSYHLLVFSLGVFALPLEIFNSWIVVYAFFFWIAFIHLLAISTQGKEIKSTFNAGFFLVFGSLFFPVGIVLFPFIWLVLLIHRLLNLRLFLISLLPIASIYLLGVIISTFFPSVPFIQEINFNAIDLTWSGFGSFRQNMWWLLFLGLFFVSMIKHYTSLGAKSASYGAGIFSLLLLGFLSLVFAVAFQSLSVISWVLFLMTVASSSTRFLEEIKRPWLREVILLIFILLFFIGK
jgi:hypothetical protein